ncbi:MAG: TIGR03560 family F420-dependent LLM class oxidoreductase [Chloroflexota bacterium]|nr:TIGR03560 family F420-dependent LLM class oxidoreductase [Chloroflexota bacterium]
MLDLAIMVEGQDGLTWPRWQRLAEAVEALGFAGLYRSDHFTNPDGPRKDALDLWASLTWLASHTRRITFGPLVSPVSFRDPVWTAWTAAAVDDLSDGRLRLGLGAGWQEREHTSFGFDLLDVPQRFARFEEGLEIVTRLLNSEEPVSFEGAFYHLHDALLLPRPNRPGGPLIVIGGNGPRRTLPLVVRYAQEWNATTNPLPRLRDLNAQLDEILNAHGRQLADVRRTYMTTVLFGRDAAEVERKLEGKTADEVRERGTLVGTADEIVSQLRALAEIGIQGVMARWWDLDDIDGLTAMAEAVLPQL